MQINLVWLRFSLSARGSTEVLFMLHTRLCQSVVRHLGRSCCCLVAKTAYCIGFYELQINFKKEAKNTCELERARATSQSYPAEALNSIMIAAAMICLLFGPARSSIISADSRVTRQVATPVECDFWWSL